MKPQSNDRLKALMFCFAVMVAISIMAGCGTAPITITVTRPAEINLKGYDRIAIGSIVDTSGSVTQHSDDIAQKITEVLFRSDRFEVLDRQHLNDIVAEHKLGMSGLIDEDSAIELGKFVGSAVLVFGRIQTDKYDEETSEQFVWIDSNGNRHGSFYREGEYTLSVNFRLVDVQTAKILAVKTLECNHTAETRGTVHAAPPIDSDALYKDCLNDIGSQFLITVAPYRVQVKAEFETDKELPEVDRALVQFEVGEWDEGVNILKSATERKDLEAEVKAKAFYNLGLAQMYSGQCEDAIKYFKQALSLNPDSSRYQSAILKAKEEKAMADKLKEQMK